MNKNFNLQMFADGDNNKQNAQSYSLQFKELLQAVFQVQGHFMDFFGGEIEAIDGVRENDNAFYVKTSDAQVVVGDYSKDANVAFGTGTSKTNRFGERKEIIYKNTPAPYTWGWSFHEGLDRHTVNNDFDEAVADRLDLQAQKKVDLFNTHQGSFISSAAGKTVAGGAKVTKDNVADVFNELHKHFINVGAKGTLKAKVNTDVYTAITDSGLATTGKGSTVNMDEGTVIKFKGFIIDEVPDALFQTNEVAYAYVESVGKAFTGIETTRTIESEDFDGKALQGAGRAGEFILKDNKKAVAKVTVTGA